jgi:hypothetical protein
MSILTAIEAATVLRCETNDDNMLDLLDQVDAYIENATGWKWSQDSAINPAAKSAARMLLVQWYENPGQLGYESGRSETVLGFGLNAVLLQLKAEAKRLTELAELNS